jgi:hypothetical protein
VADRADAREHERADRGRQSDDGAVRSTVDTGFTIDRPDVLADTTR